MGLSYHQLVGSEFDAVSWNRALTVSVLLFATTYGGEMVVQRSHWYRFQGKSSSKNYEYHKNSL